MGEVGEGEAGFQLSKEPQAWLDTKTLALGRQQKADVYQGSHPGAPLHDSIRFALINPLDETTRFGICLLWVNTNTLCFPLLFWDH